MRLAIPKRIKRALKGGISPKAILRAGVVNPQIICAAATANMPALVRLISINNNKFHLFWLHA